MDSSESATVNWMETRDSLVESILKDFDALKQVWERIGFDEEMLHDRCKQAVTHFTRLSAMMIEEDEDLFERLVENVKQLKQTLRQYCAELDLPVPEVEEFPPLVLKRRLVALLDSVSSTRQSRLDSLEELRSRESDLCGSLGMEPHKFKEDRPVPTEQDLEELAQHVQMLVTEKESRMRKYLVLRSDILIAMDLLQKSATSPLQVELASGVPGESEICLSREKLAAMETLSQQLDQEKAERARRMQEMTKELSFLWEVLGQDKEQLQEFLRKNGQKGFSGVEKELSRCRALRKANMGKFITSLRKEVHNWWDKCRASDHQRQLFSAHLASEDFTQELLEVHEQEVLRWRGFYQQFEPLFVKVQKITGLFQKALQLQQKTTDKNRFHNRGGQLLQEEKERKKVLLLIPKMAEELEVLGEEYEAVVGSPFTVGGQGLKDFLQSQWELFLQEKENDKLQRKQRKEEELSAATATPRKRNLLGATAVLFKSPGNAMMSVRGMTLRSPSAHKIPTFTPTAGSTPLKRQLPKSPAPYVRETPQKLRCMPALTPSSSKAQTRVAAVVPLSYSAFEGPLIEQGRSMTKRSTMNSTTVKVLGSKRTPVFTNSGAKRKRFSNGRSPKLSSRAATRNSPRQPLATSIRGPNALKVAKPDVPFLY